MNHKKQTRKQILEKYENLKIDTQRRIADLRKENGELRLGAAQVSQAVDILLGYICQEYGMLVNYDHKDDGPLMWELQVPKTDMPVRIESRVWVKDDEVLGTIITATEAEDEQVREQADND